MWYRTHKLLEFNELHNLLQQELLRKNVRGTPRERRCVVEQILFEQYEISMELIESYYLPFGNSGYLSTQQKFNRMLYLAAKGNHGKGIRRFFELTGWLHKDNEVITNRDINQVYLDWCDQGMCEFDEKDKRTLFLDAIDPMFGHDVLERLIKESDEKVLVGECMLSLLPKGTQKKGYETVGIVLQGKPMLLDFLGFSSEEQMITFLHALIAREKQGELTKATPRWKGNTIEAVRPPAGDWGFTVSLWKGEESSC